MRILSRVVRFNSFGHYGARSVTMRVILAFGGNRACHVAGRETEGRPESR